MPRPTHPPLGLTLTRSARAIERVFDERLAAVGGSAPVWQILISLKTGGSRNQRELARMVGIRGATLTHHLNAMETAGLITRRRHPENRRVHIVEMTESGSEMFLRLREVAVTFDRTLRTGLEPDDLEVFGRVLRQLYANVMGRDAAETDFLPVRPPD
ncbi:MAG: MarR family winged helix-turn-helix transcriptional regulator [Propionibacteriaceae bacterium]